MAKLCGDKANLEYEVEAPLVGDFAHIKVQRFDRKSLTASGFQELTSTKTKMKWPDQEVEDGHGYYGGRQVDFKGLNKKSYSDKFVQQNFSLTIQHEDQSVDSSKTEIIEELPTAKTPNHVVGIPMETEKWIPPPTKVNPFTGAVIKLAWSKSSSWPSNFWAEPAQRKHNAGRFDIEHKDGVTIITVKIKLQSTVSGKNTKIAFKYIKKIVEAFWNSEAQGFNQWIYHRTGCERKEKCNCSIVKNRKGEYITSGCCKVPFKVVIEEGGASDNIVYLHYLSPGQRRQARANIRASSGGKQLPRNHPNYWGARIPSTAQHVNSYNLYYPENRAGTYAHEVGHMLGFPDQYTTGAIAKGAMDISGRVSGATWPIDESSVMGSSQNKAMKYHLEAQWFNDWINSKVDKMTVIDKP